MEEIAESNEQLLSRYHGMYLLRPKNGRMYEVKIGIWHAGGGALHPHVESDFRAAGMPPNSIGRGWMAVLAMAVPADMYCEGLREQKRLEKAGVSISIDPVEQFLANRLFTDDPRFYWRNYISKVQRVEKDQFIQFLRYASRKSIVGSSAVGQIVTVIAGPLAGKTGVVRYESEGALGIAIDGGDIVRVDRFETDIELARLQSERGQSIAHNRLRHA